LPKIRFANLPGPVWEHILQRVAERSIALSELQRLKKWVDTEPPSTRWRLVQGLRFVHPMWHRRVPEDRSQEGHEAYGKPLSPHRVARRTDRKAGFSAV